jgi:hypothetical protein
MHVIPSHSESSPSVASPPVVRKLAVVHRQPVAPPSDRTVGRDPPSGALRAARRDPSSAALSEDPLRRHDALVGQEVVCRSHLRRNTGLDVPPGRALWALPLEVGFHLQELEAQQLGLNQRGRSRPRCPGDRGRVGRRVHLFLSPIVVGGGQSVPPQRCPREARNAGRTPFRQRHGSPPLPHQDVRRRRRCQDV